MLEVVAAPFSLKHLNNMMTAGTSFAQTVAQNRG
jgi:hypothetical protein